MDVDTVDTVLMRALQWLGMLRVSAGDESYVRRTKYCAIPVSHHEVVAVGQAIGASFCVSSQ